MKTYEIPEIKKYQFNIEDIIAVSAMSVDAWAGENGDDVKRINYQNDLLDADLFDF